MTLRLRHEPNPPEQTFTNSVRYKLSFLPRIINDGPIKYKIDEEKSNRAEKALPNSPVMPTFLNKDCSTFSSFFPHRNRSRNVFSANANTL